MKNGVATEPVIFNCSACNWSDLFRVRVKLFFFAFEFDTTAHVDFVVADVWGNASTLMTSTNFSVFGFACSFCVYVCNSLHLPMENRSAANAIPRRINNNFNLNASPCTLTHLYSQQSNATYNLYSPFFVSALEWLLIFATVSIASCSSISCTEWLRSTLSKRNQQNRIVFVIFFLFQNDFPFVFISIQFSVDIFSAVFSSHFTLSFFGRHLSRNLYNYFLFVSGFPFTELMWL